VILIGCTKEKLSHAAPARDLYTGRVFRASVAYAEAKGEPWAVLSALHGVVLPDAVIEPYDVTLADRPRAERLSWAGLVAEQLDELGAPSRITVLAGGAYVDGCERYGRHRTFDAPLAGMGAGERYAALLRMREAVVASKSESDALDDVRRWIAEAGDAGEVTLSGRWLAAVREAVANA